MTINFTLTTRNEGAGFFGTAYLAGNGSAFATEAWNVAFENVISATYAIKDAQNWPDAKVRDFLDSVWGRHYADFLRGNPANIKQELQQPAHLQKACKLFAKTYDPADFE